MADIHGYETTIDNVPFRLKSPFDFLFLKKYGQIFKVLDDQDSGNICFGVVDDSGQKYFVKFAGAPTVRANLNAEEAIAVLKQNVTLYHDLTHPCLSRLISVEDIGGGFAIKFEWADAICMGRQYPEEHQQFMALPLATRVKIFEDILAFHVNVAAQGYVAIDFYDGSIMFNPTNTKTVICDIELYEKMPYINNMGRMFGSSRFMSPEEFILGAEIDEVSNVYTMGATAFALLAEYDRTPEKWLLDVRLYNIVQKAVSDERNKRQQSIRQLVKEWEKANKKPILLP